MADLTAMLQAAAGNVGGDYQIERSLRFNSADSAYLSRTPASAGNRKTWTWSGWVKRSALGTYQVLFGYMNASFTDQHYIRFTDTDTLDFAHYTSSTYQGRLVTTQVFRDISAWLHVVAVWDTGNATAGNRMRLYINGSEVTNFSTDTNPSQNYDGFINTTIEHNIGRYLSNGVAAQQHYFSGYLADINFIDGQALTPSSFGEVDAVTGVWKPIAYAGTYGTNGFHLDFSDNSSTTALGYDAAGSNDWTLNNFSVTAGAGNDSLVDSPTQYGTDTGAGGEVRGNYATWNPLINGDSAANGNLDVTNDTARSTQSLLQFDTYWEITSTGGTTTAGTVSATGTTNTTTIADTKTYGFRLTTAGTLDYINITDGGSFTNITTGLTGQQFIYASAASATTGSLNTGQRPFAATAPSGFKALVTTNLPDPTVVQGDDHFNTVLYTGNGSTQSVTGVGFAPDFVWIKSRSTADYHWLFDRLRGVTNAMFSNTTSAENNYNNSLTAFGSDGFTSGSEGGTNGSGQSMVAWNWKANGAGVSNTDGTITSTVSANTTAGISIVTYTGNGTAATVGHGLGAAPRMIIVKNRDQADAWQIYHAANTANPETDYLVLNTTAGTADAADRWNDTLPTSTVFSIGNGVEVNTNTEKYVAYCFAEVEGFSKFGSYTGNASADGPFVYTGFRPAFVMTKATSSTSEWTITDFKRPGYNLVNKSLYANKSNAELTYNVLDQVSNGFKLRDSDGIWNGSGTTYIYMAFAENPFKYSLAR